jgi:hypothetical protein
MELNRDNKPRPGLKFTGLAEFSSFLDLRHVIPG